MKYPVRGAELPSTTTFHVHVGHDGTKLAGQCYEVDVFALMDSPEGLELAIRFLLCRELGLNTAEAGRLDVVLT